MGVHHGSHYTMFSDFLRNLESHNCYEDFIKVFSFIVHSKLPHKVTASLFIDFWYRSFIFLFSGGSSMFESPEQEDPFFFEVTVGTGFWYGLFVIVCWWPLRVNFFCYYFLCFFFSFFFFLFFCSIFLFGIIFIQNFLYFLDGESSGLVTNKKCKRRWMRVWRT